MIRIQVGWLDRHPIRVPCGSCGILITGELVLDQPNAKFETTFQNATELYCQDGEPTPAFYTEASGDFVTAKIRAFHSSIYEDEPTPFMRATMWMGGPERYVEYTQHAQGFLQLTREEWPRVRRVHELWQTQRLDLLEAELEKHFHKTTLAVPRELNLLQSAHRVWVTFLSPLFVNDELTTAAKTIFGEIENFRKHRLAQFRALVENFSRRGLLVSYEQRLLVFLKAFVDQFKYLLPIFSTQFFTDAPNDYRQTMGMSTASFEDLKELFIDGYELAGDLLRLVVAYNNLKHRGKFRVMVAKRRDVVSLEDFESKPKGVRLGYLGSETFDALVSGGLDHKLRNAIGHGTFRYDAAAQLVAYFPDGNEQAGNALTMNFLEFCQKLWTMCMDTLVRLAELVYQTRKVQLML